MSDLKTHEDALAQLEAPLHAAKHARHNHETLKNTYEQLHVLLDDDGKRVAQQKIADAEAAIAPAEETADKLHHECRLRGASLSRAIDEAAQRVLDARGEAHTETNILGK